MDYRINNGGARKGAGRKPKADEQLLIEKLSPLENAAYKALKDALSNSESWAVKLWFEYSYGKPKQQADISLGGIPPIIWNEQRNYTKEERDKRLNELIDKRQAAQNNILN